MAGGFAHITLVDTLCKDGDGLDAIENLTPTLKRFLSFNLIFVELGAVSPDYPYLSLLSNNAAGWANTMHYWKTMDFVRKAVPLVYDMDWRKDVTGKCIAWLFGYTAHVVTDLTVHPVVNLKVGPYAQNKRAHRACEMNQDVYIFNEINHDEITRAEYIQNGGIAACCREGDKKHLEPEVADLWKRCLPSVADIDLSFDPELKCPTRPPDPDSWHHNFVKMVDDFAEEGGRLPYLTRHVVEYAGLVYPALSDLDRGYIDSLATPEGTMSYDGVFRRAQDSVRGVWSQLGKALDTGKPKHLTTPNGNLDNGRDESGKMIFWREAV